jgi:hypothetical protein
MKRRKTQLTFFHSTAGDILDSRLHRSRRWSQGCSGLGHQMAASQVPA